jgi:hypothetical protein
VAATTRDESILDAMANRFDAPPSALQDFDSRETLTYAELRALLEREATRVAADLKAGRRSDDPHEAFLPLNLHRTARIDKTFRVPPDLRQRVVSLREPQFWRVVTEPWCGDSAQSLGVIAAIAASSPQIDLRFQLRDQHPDLMDRYLTDGNRAIPLLLAFDASGNELFRWGPRSRPARELFRLGQQAGLPKDQLLQRLHSWYALDRGRSVTRELEDLIRQSEEVPVAQEAWTGACGYAEVS